MDQLRVAVIGTGFGRVHVDALRADPRCQVVAVCSSRLTKAQAAAEELQIPHATDDWRALLRRDLQAVTIAVPPPLQQQIALAALEAGLAVFAEKPLANDLPAARQLARLAQSTGLANMVDFEFVCLPAWERAIALLSGGAIGRLQHITVNWHVETHANRLGLVNWKTTAEDGGGALMLFTSHVLYYLEQLAGPAKSVSAHLLRAPGDVRSGDTLNLLALRHVSGATASICVNNHAVFGSGHTVECYGDQGCLVLKNPTPDYVRGFELWLGQRGGQMAPVSIDQLPDPFADGRTLPVAGLMRRFADWVLTGRRARPDFHDGCRVQELIEAARTSARQSGWIEVTP